MRFPLCFGHPNLEINIFPISYTVISYQFLSHFYISCPDKPGIRKQERGCYEFEIEDVTQFVDFRVS